MPLRLVTPRCLTAPPDPGDPHAPASIKVKFLGSAFVDKTKEKGPLTVI